MIAGYTPYIKAYLPGIHRGRVFFLWARLLTIVLCLGLPASGRAVGNDGADPQPDGSGYEETSVFVNVQRIGGTEMPAIVGDRRVFLSPTTVFDFLKIKAEASPGFDSVWGYFIDPEARFCIDYYNKRIRYKGTTMPLHAGTDIIQTESNLYLRLELFGQLFGLNSAFDFSNLTVRMNASMDLPAVREAQLAQMHQNLSRLRGETKADTNIHRRYPIFSAGFADWYLSALKQSNDADNVHLGLSLGGMLAGGELNVLLNYGNDQPFSERQQSYQWRFVNNDRKALRQVTLGRIFANATASVYNPVIGVQVTNAPTTYRRSAGSYRLSRTTQPNWTVELYVNNVLVDYVKADASGFFQFDVPLVYGTTVVKLRYYGLYGEERSTEENIAIPFNFLPKGQVEYTASAGYVEDTAGSRFGRAIVSYGVSRHLTVGAGTEYLSAIAGGANMPFANASLRLPGNIMLTAEHAHGVRSRAMLNYYMPHNGQLELSYTKFAPGQQAIVYNFQEERKLIYSIPYHTRSFSGVTRLMVNQSILTDRTSYSTAEWLLSGMLSSGIGANINTYVTATGQQDPPRFVPSVYSNASLVYRRQGFTITPQAQYSYDEQAFISARCELEKNFLGCGYFNIAYERNFKSNVSSLSAGLRYDLRFARAGVASRRYNDITSLTITASGSLIRDRNTGRLHADNRPAVGHCGITLMPYLDLNGNGRRDAGEPRVGGVRARISSGRVIYNKRDTVVNIYDLEPYANYFIDLGQNNFENISWQLRNKTMRVATDPNEMKGIEVPVAVMNEGAGSVYLQGEGDKTKGLSRINVCFYRPDGSSAGCALSDPDGYYSYLGLLPGTYTVRPDAAQLRNLRMSASPELRTITISASREGAMSEGLNFTLTRTAGR